MNQKNIRNIIFDLGGVVLDVDYQQTIDAFHQLGIRNFEKQFSQAVQSDLFASYEKGLITDTDLRAKINKLSGLNLSDHQIDFAWNSMVGQFDRERIELIRSIKSNYHIFLLSNTNSIHYRFFIDLFNRDFQTDFHTLFHKAYYSFEIKLRKPDQEIFEYVLRDASIKKEETLFIDDSIQHIGSARRLGIPSYHLLKDESIIQLFENGRLTSDCMASL